MGKRRKRNVGHPATYKSRRQRRNERAANWQHPDATEKDVQDANRRMRRAIQESQPGEGLVVGPMTAAAEVIVDQILATHNLDESHKLPIIAYLVGIWGETIHLFPGSMEILGYFEWREQSRQHVIGASHE